MAEVMDLEELMDTSDLPDHPGVLHSIDLVEQTKVIDLYKHVRELKEQSKRWAKEIELSDDFKRDLIMLHEEAKTLQPMKDSILQKLANVLVKSRQHKKRQMDRELEEDFEVESELLSRKQEKIDDLEHENDERNRVDLEKKRARNIFELEQTRVEKEIQVLEQEFAFEVETGSGKVKKAREMRRQIIEETVAEDTKNLAALTEGNVRKLAEKQEEQERETFERDDNHRKEKEYHEEQLLESEKTLHSSTEVTQQLQAQYQAAVDDLETNRAMLLAKNERLVESEQQSSKAEDDVNNFRTEIQKAYEEAVRWSREQYETWIQAIGTRREEVDRQLRLSLEQLFERRVDAIKPLDAKVRSVSRRTRFTLYLRYQRLLSIVSLCDVTPHFSGEER